MFHRFTRSRAMFAVITTPATLGVFLLLASASSAQVPAEESAKLMKPAEGMEVSLWASEPMVVNPTNMDIDSRGRVWITEGLNYRTTHGGGQGFPRHEDADKIKILEDTDGDGKADKVTVFADKIWPIPMGLAVEETYSKEGKYLGARVYVGNSPDILVFEDTDGDDKADKREVLLTGFGGVDSDHGVHGMVLGMDGKLYFTHGDGCCSYEVDHGHKERNFNVTDKTGRHVWSDQLANTLRVDRDGKNFEIIADRQRNNYETTLNSFGNIFTSDNDDDGNRGSRVIWVMEGGKYGYRTPGSPRHWGEDVPGNVPKLVGTGNGSPCGVMVYEGSLLPDMYQGAVLEAEAGPRVINAFPITRKGAAFRTEHKIMLASDDPWFRPVDVTAAPDGSVFVCDWYDGGVGGHAFRDQTTGRIYRLTPKGKTAVKPETDFATPKGLIAGLESPCLATRDTAARLIVDRLMASDKAMSETLQETATKSPQLTSRSRAIQVLSRYMKAKGVDQGNAMSVFLADREPQIRELAIRLLGRDVSRMGKVELPAGSERAPLAAEANLELLLRADSSHGIHDPDAGVRREMILALRDLPTSKVGPALKTLAASWDGQDRWYLEALGLALKDREPEFLKELFDGSLFGELNLEESGKNGDVALPPYFPVDRNEAFISTVDPELPPANALSKSLGLAWMIHRAEVLPLLAKILPSLSAPELQQAADDVLTQVTDPAGAVTLAEQAMVIKDPARRRQILSSLASKLDGAWKSAHSDPLVLKTIESALSDPSTRVEGIDLAGATGNAAYGARLTAIATDPDEPEPVRVAAVEAVARVKAPDASRMIDTLITQAMEKQQSNPAAEVALRSMARLGDSTSRMKSIMTNEEAPLGLRREALRSLATQGDGARQLLAMARDKTIPEVLRTEAATVLRAHPDGGIRNAAIEAMPIVSASGRPLPSNGELVRRDGQADRGREVFFKAGATTCSSCHRVQGRGQWIGPDLSTIGVKYGKDELLRSILNPSAAIGYNDRSLVVGLTDGRLLTGLMVEDTPDRLLLKTSDGKRVAIKPSEIEERRISEVSLMPEGLAQAMQEQEIVDLLAYLSTLKQPVSIVGQFSALGPVADSIDQPAIDPAHPTKSAEEKHLSFRRLNANAEGQVDVSSILGDVRGRSAYLYTPITSSVEQNARLVIDSGADITVWLNGKTLEMPAASEGEPRSASVTLPRGSSDLVIRVAAGDATSLVATFVTGKPVEFSSADSTKVSDR